MSQADKNSKEPARGALWQRAVVGVVAVLIWGISVLPSFLAYVIGDVLAVFWFIAWSFRDPRGKRSSGYWRNTRIAFREGTQLGAIKPPNHLWRWSRHIGWMVIDSCRMRRLTPENLSDFCDLRDYEHIRELYEEGNGVIFATGHVGVWDLSGVIAGLLGLPITSVFRPSPLPALNRLIERMRTGTGQTVVARKNVMWTLKKVLGDKKVIGILADGGGKHSAVEAPFLGTSARSVATPALLHLATGAPIAIVAILRTARGQYRLRLYDIIRDAGTGPNNREKDLAVITTRCNFALGEAIKEAPEQWFWQSRRFRHRPTGELPNADGLPPLSTMDSQAHDQERVKRYRSPRGNQAKN
jgi:Kdo2-lipid IVA lauroyltransferase/acyltransferase